MITRFLRRACVLALVLSATSVAQEANAEVMCWMICEDCDPTIDYEARQEILTQDQQGGCSNAGSRNGWEQDDTVVIQKADGSAIGRWEYQAGVDRWDPVSPDEGYTCPRGLWGYEACIDMTPGYVLQPTYPWSLPELDPPTIANVFCELHNNCGWTY